MDLNQLLNLAQNKGYKVFYKPDINMFSCTIYYKEEYLVIARLITPEPSFNENYQHNFITRVIVAKQQIKDKLIEVLNLKIENE